MHRLKTLQCGLCGGFRESCSRWTPESTALCIEKKNPNISQWLIQLKKVILGCSSSVSFSFNPSESMLFNKFLKAEVRSETFLTIDVCKNCKVLWKKH